jgi:putative transposase
VGIEARSSRARPSTPFLRFNSSPEVIRLVVMMYVRFPMSLRNVEDLLFERGIDICEETVRIVMEQVRSAFRWRNPPGTGEPHARLSPRWHRDGMYAKLNGEMLYLRQAVDQKGAMSRRPATRQPPSLS